MRVVVVHEEDEGTRLGTILQPQRRLATHVARLALVLRLLHPPVAVEGVADAELGEIESIDEKFDIRDVKKSGYFFA